MPDLMDEIIRAAMARGAFDNLPGQAKPLKLDENPYTPPQMRTAYKLLADNGFAPDWMTEGRALEHDREAFVAELGRARVRLRASSPAEQKTLRAALEGKAGALNRRLLSFNLKAPKGVAHKALIDLKRELE